MLVNRKYLDFIMEIVAKNNGVLRGIGKALEDGIGIADIPVFGDWFSVSLDEEAKRSCWIQLKA